MSCAVQSAIELLGDSGVAGGITASSGSPAREWSTAGGEQLRTVSSRLSAASTLDKLRACETSAYHRLRAFLLGISLSRAIAEQRESGEAPADSSRLDFHEFGLLAIQNGGRRKPIDTFARETLIRIGGRSTYTDKAGRKWSPSDFILSAALETRDWRNEPMVLISLG